MGCSREKWILFIWFASYTAELACLPTREFGARLSGFEDVPSTTPPRIISSSHSAQQNKSSPTNLVKPSVATRSTNISYVWHYMPDDEGGAEKVVRTPSFKSFQTDAKYLTKPLPNHKLSSVKEHRQQLVKKNSVEKEASHKLVPSSNLYYNNVEPFWPFSNRTSGFLNFDAGPLQSLPERFKETTFFFSHVGPNSFEYRAQFHHSPSFEPPKEWFNTFVDKFPEFPEIPFPKFPSFPEEPPERSNKPQFPNFFDAKFEFPNIPPPPKRIPHSPVAGPQGQVDRASKADFERPHYDVVLGEIHTKYPKIFKFNDERINIQDFEQRKKHLTNNFLLEEPDSVQRKHLLILHGGIFTVKEPPLFQKKVIRKRKQRMFHSNRISKHQ